MWLDPNIENSSTWHWEMPHNRIHIFARLVIATLLESRPFHHYS
jgi:hypothetical protein